MLININSNISMDRFMKKISAVILFTILMISYSAYADMSQRTVTIKAVPENELAVNKATKVMVKLSRISDGKAIGENDLKIAHTKKLHLLVIDQSLTDYQHIHPVATDTAGEYSFDFTPKKDGTYRIWADIKPVETDTQEYIFTDIGKEKPDLKVDKSTNTEALVDGYKFKLLFDSPLTAGKASLGSIKVEDPSGKEVNYLEPVMGAFGHIVAFSEDHDSVLHVHPMGKEPESEDERGGPELQFHIEPKSAGFIRLFAQVKIKGKDIFAPFGLMVNNVVAGN
jgi:hypothetical protein